MDRHTQNEKNRIAAIRNLQEYLRQISYTDRRIPVPPVDGIFGAQTEASLKAFQKGCGIEETGKADAETWEALYHAYRASLAESALPIAISVFPLRPIGFAYREGDRGFAVTVIRFLLREASIDRSELEEIEPGEEYDRATAEAVKSLQRTAALPQTGEVDRLTWNYLAETWNHLHE